MPWLHVLRSSTIQDINIIVWLTFNHVDFHLGKCVSDSCDGFEITFVLEKHVVEDDALLTNHLAGK